MKIALSCPASLPATQFGGIMFLCLDIAKESEHPRVYEVAGQLIKTVGETTEKLIDLQQKMKELDHDDSGPQKVSNNLFVGSTAELQKMIKDK